MDAPGVFADATALIGLARIDRLDLLDLLPGPIYVTDRVWLEVATDPTKPGFEAILRARNQHLLRIVEEGDANAFPDLDAGEATVLSAAIQRRAAVLIDERAARTLIATNPEIRRLIPQSTGVVGVILLAKRRGRIDAVGPLLDALVRESFRIGHQLYEEALRRAGER